MLTQLEEPFKHISSLGRKNPFPAHANGQAAFSSGGKAKLYRSSSHHGSSGPLPDQSPAAMMAGRMSHSRFYDCAFSRGRSLAVHFDAASERLSNFSGDSLGRHLAHSAENPCEFRDIGCKTGGNAVIFLLIIV
ncbi:hypothetical protein [Pararhizobium qamdonense]|uniref:hypothetical protein n=1 Tax=Pararhizobium qamdonense TaxID=3031126 RepID=UPI0023E22B4B|nr:hypothetical protein [Pararhizobium qamdonense]